MYPRVKSSLREKHGVEVTGFYTNLWKLLTRTQDSWDHYAVKRGKRDKPLFKLGKIDPMSWFVDDEVKEGAAKALSDNQLLAIGVRERFMRKAL